MVLDAKETFAGGVGAVCCAYSGNPFDVVKVRLQTQRPLAECVAGEFYSGPVDCLKKIVRDEGAVSLWKGVTPALGSAMIENGVLFSMNGIISRAYCSRLSRADSELSVADRATIGGLSGIFSATCITPAEMIKCRAQIAHKKVSPSSILISAYREGGLPAVFRGWTSTIARDVPFSFFFFGAYEAWTALLSGTNLGLFCSAGYIRAFERDDVSFNATSSIERRLNPFGIYVAGGMAGATAWSISFPIDSIKSRVQTAASSTSFLSVGRKIFNSSGVKGFYKGYSSAVARAFPANAGLLLGYEMAIELIQ